MQQKVSFGCIVVEPIVGFEVSALVGDPESTVLRSGASLLRGVQPTVVLSRWVCRCRKRQAPSMETLAPLRRGFFVRVFCALYNRLWYWIGGFAGQRLGSHGSGRVSGRQAWTDDLAPPPGGASSAITKPTGRLGVGVAGLLRTGEIGKPV
jgi:hypothetical protein